MNTKICIAALSTALLAACSSGSGSSDIVTIDLAANVGAADTGSSEEIMKVESIITPALTDSTMMNFPKICGAAGSNLYLMQQSRAGTNLMVFNANTGECISSFDKTGNGPGEYRTVYNAYRSPDSGSWVVFDINVEKVYTYSIAGSFITSFDLTTAESIAPLGNGWLGENRRENDIPKVFYRFNSRFAVTDSIITNQRWHVTREGVSSVTRLQPAGKDLVYWHENDTLYSIPAHGDIKAEVAFNLGRYKMPLFDSYETERAERHKYITYFAFATDNAVIVYYMHNDNVYAQIYAKADGALRYAVTLSKESYGFPLVVDGTTYHGIPSYLNTDGSVIFTVLAEEMAAVSGNEEANPGFIKARINL